MTSDPDFKVTIFFEVEYRKNLKDKVTTAHEEKYLTYGMLMSLVPLTDLQTRRAGLTASTELLVSSAEDINRINRSTRISGATRNLCWGCSCFPPLRSRPPNPARGSGGAL